ncbi:MAG: GDP-mannose 4,6-dehydratase [Candidatus Omnitrophica bacterium]|nr:GDP-mannose 4,6-dehydratase [Candidatus Omnitrophota bacterium]
MNKSFWKGKVVLVSGYEGFLGSHLTKKLISFGAKVIGVDIKAFRKETIINKVDYRNIKVVKGDVADERLLAGIFKRNRISFVFHLAAEAIVNRSLQDPARTFSSNIQGTWNLLECCRKSSSVKAIVVASSDKAYGEHKKLPYQENFPLRGLHPYDVSKSCADLIVQAYFNTFQLPAAITRCGNIFGPGDFNLSRIVPETIISIINNKPLIIRSDGQYIRDYVYIDDIINGYILLAENLQKGKLSGEAFNFSVGKPLTVIEIVELIYKIAAQKPCYKVLGKARHEIRRQYLSSDKARKVLRWQPQVTLESALKKTIDWYREYSES